MTMDLRAVRLRLTAWYTLVLAAVMSTSGVASYAIIKRQLRIATEHSLASSVRQLQNALQTEAANSGGVLTAKEANEELNEVRDRERPMKMLTGDGRPFAAGAPFTRHERIRMERIRIGNAAYIVIAGQSLDSEEDLLHVLREGMLLTIPLALLIAAAGGSLLARENLAPVAEAFESQRRFMAEASHELRTPVSILQGEIDVTLSHEREASEYRESLAIMRRSAQRLTRIVRDLFLLARGDAGQYPISDERFYLDEVVAQIVASYRTVAAERGIALREEHEHELLMRGDEDLIERMIGNLLDNAIRHAKSEVVVRCTKGRIEVRDDGEGVPPELREKIFERFFRGEPSRTGLGLPIARWIAEAHGGTLKAGGGSVFVITLPQEKIKSPAQ